MQPLIAKTLGCQDIKKSNFRKHKKNSAEAAAINASGKRRQRRATGAEQVQASRCGGIALAGPLQKIKI